MNLRRKIEKGINDYLRAHRGPHFTGFSIIDGHDNVEPVIPFLTGYCGRSQPHPDLPAEEGVVTATHVFHLKTQAQDEERSKADNRLEELMKILAAPIDPTAEISDENKRFSDLIAALNANLDLELLVYDIYPSDDVNAFAGKNWDDQLAFSVVAQSA